MMDGSTLTLTLTLTLIRIPYDGWLNREGKPIGKLSLIELIRSKGTTPMLDTDHDRVPPWLRRLLDRTWKFDREARLSAEDALMELSDRLEEDWKIGQGSGLIDEDPSSFDDILFRCASSRGTEIGSGENSPMHDLTSRRYREGSQDDLLLEGTN